MDDFGRCVAEIAVAPQYKYFTLELCGPENISVKEMISDIEEVIGHKIELKCISDDELRDSMSARNSSEYSIETLLMMFHHYNSGDFCGSAFTATSILKRTPARFAEFLNREHRELK